MFYVEIRHNARTIRDVKLLRCEGSTLPAMYVDQYVLLSAASLP